jgi:outer membrane protein assembly factor BamB
MITTKSSVALVLTGLCVFSSFSATRMTAADWPCFRGPNHNGISVEPISWPKGGPKQLWKVNVGIGHSAVSVVGNRAYTMGNTNDTDTIFSLDAGTGKVIWKHSYPCSEKVGIKDYDGPFATPTVANGVVYTLSRKGDVFALNARDGKVIWARNIVQDDGVKPPTFGGLAGSPLVMDGKVFLNASPGGMALDAATGKTLWKSGVGTGGHSSPVPFRVGPKTYLAIHSPRALTIVDSADGKELWTTPRLQPIRVNAPDPVVEGTKVFVTAGRGFGGTLFDTSGDTKALWEQEGLSSHWHTSVLWKGFLYGPDGNNSEGAGRSATSLRSLDWKTGEIRWTEPKLGFNGLIVVGGKLLVLTETGDAVLAEASPDGYKELGLAHVIEGRAFTAPAFANGKLYARNTKGDVVCVDFGK